MKTLATIFSAVSAVALSVGAAPVLAQTGDAISLTQSAPACLRLRVANATPLAGRVQVVRLSTGQPLFTETYTAPEYGHRFDFSQAPSGRYLVYLQSGAVAYRCIVRVRTNAYASAIRVNKLTSRALPVTQELAASPVMPASIVMGQR